MPQRFLRPGLRNSERWNSVSRVAQVLYVGLLTLVDDYGQFDGRTSVIHGECFAVWNDLHPDNPQESAATRSALQELVAAGMVEIWTNEEGKPVMEVTQWQERVREGAKRKWGIRRNPQESAGIRSEILPPTPTPVSIASTPSSIASTPSPTPLAGERAVIQNGNRLHRIPKDAEEVVAYGKTLCPPKDEETCREFFRFYEGQARTNHNGDVFWVTSGDNGTVITNWKMKLPDFGKSKKPTPADHRAEKAAREYPEPNLKPKIIKVS